MKRATVAVSTTILALALTGCARSKPQASMGVLRAEPATLSLGAGDSLGRAIYVADLVIAAREAGLDVAVTSVTDQSPTFLGE
jgi:uncharacterized lipoprotein YmbA